MPFPPKTEEDFFDYEATLNRIVGIVYQNYGTQADMGQRALEAQLTADEHSTSILKAEIEKEQRLLDEDKKELEHLERAFRDEEARRQRHNKGLHPLAKRLEHHHDRDRTIHANPWLGSENPMSSCGAIENDVSLAALLEQLYSHLGSMHNNTRSIKQIPLAMDTSQAALDSFTWRFLDKDKYAQLHGLDVT
jgi:kinetochore protein Fta7